MEKTFKHEDIEQILAEADALLKQTDPEVIEYMEEERRLQLAQHAQSLKKLKSEVQDKIGKEGSTGEQILRRGNARGDRGYREGDEDDGRLSHLISVLSAD